MMQFAHPGLLWLFLLFIPVIAWYIYSWTRNEASLQLSATQAFDGMHAGWRVWFKHLLFASLLGAMGCLIIILCRPQTHDSWATSDVEGTDIVVALDVSTSMLARDFRPNRL